MTAFDKFKKELESSSIKPISRQILPIKPLAPQEEKFMMAQNYLESLGYFSYGVYDDEEDICEKECNKYFDYDKYEAVADKIYDLYINGQEIPQNLINYMLQVKAIIDKHGLYV